MNSSQRGLHSWSKYLIRNLFLEKLYYFNYVISLCLSNMDWYVNVYKKKFLLAWYCYWENGDFDALVVSMKTVDQQKVYENKTST